MSAPTATNTETTDAVADEIAPSSAGTFARLLRFAFANIRRRPERFVLTVLGIALAIMAVTVVRTISASYADVGARSVDAALGGAPLWVVPAQGIHYDPATRAILAEGPAPTIQAPTGWSADQVLTGTWRTGGHTVALYGVPGTAAGTASVGADAAEELGLSAGDPVTVGGRELTVTESGPSSVVSVPYDVAQSAGAENGWWRVTGPAGDGNRNDLGALLSAATGLPSTTTAATTPAVQGTGLIYDTVGGTSAVTFRQQFSALLSGSVTTSTLGLVSTIGLVLGFVIAVSSFLAAVQERRREFGIMSSIGLADEVLYFFLVESAVVFAAAYALGVLLAGAAVALVVPTIASPLAWAQAAGTVVAYLPAMAIVGALVPVQRLLQQRPVDLLADSA